MHLNICATFFWKISQLQKNVIYFFYHLNEKLSTNTLNLIELGNIFYNRETIAKLNYEICTVKVFPFYTNQIICPFPNSRISANHVKDERLSANCEILIKENFTLL